MIISGSAATQFSLMISDSAVVCVKKISPSAGELASGVDFRVCSD